MKKKEIKLVVQRGQYESQASVVTVKYTTERGLYRRIKQLKDEYAVYGDNWAGWIKASVAFADPRDKWYDNQFIGGQCCEPYNGWIDLDEGEEV